MIEFKEVKIGVIGLGYVGLPLAVEFAKRFPVVGFDIDEHRISDLKAGDDSTLEVDSHELKNNKALFFSFNLDDIKDCNVYIVTVPTPIDQYNQPDLSMLESSSAMLGSIISEGDFVIYESTVYPGATEEECVPILEDRSGLKLNDDFFVGYSPERINPGDKNHRVANILKITSGSNREAADFVDFLYSQIVSVGTHKTSSIKVAEAAKVIENTQRDVNIALINELSIIFGKLKIDTLEILEAAGTKWNFLPFRPGLVGGHCIGVDPYYLTHKAQSIGHHPEMILAGRRINDGMAAHVSSQLVKRMIKKSIQVDQAKVLIMGLTFKENCPDLRNTKVIDIVHELQDYGIEVDVIEPWCSKQEVMDNCAIELIDSPEEGVYDSIIVAVGHEQFKSMSIENIQKWGKSRHIIYDLKYIFPDSNSTIRL
jgi:UDP-N-acetyl-D-glucosamine/UDP-N-acetyl-D-galactosamine dehydrogenase